MTVKLLPCANSPACKARGFALWPPSRLHPEGEPAFAGQYVSRYTCARCHKVTTVSAVDWHRLPELSHSDHFDALAKHFNGEAAREAVRGLPTMDLEGIGLKRAHARDMFHAGFDVMDVRAIERGAEAKTTEGEATN